MLRRPSFWKEKGLVSFLLLPISLLFIIATYLRYLLVAFKGGAYRAKGKVICIGNHVVGGAGKTPISYLIGKICSNSNKKSCFVCMGYGRKIKEPSLVKNDSVYEYGDEALILKEVLPVIVATNKAEGVKFADKMGFELIIVDDGLQNPGFAKDLAVLVYNKRAEENGFILPAGPCRERFSSALVKADVVIDFSSSLDKELDGKSVFRAQKNFACKCQRNTNVVIFSAIAQNNVFAETVAKLGYNIVETYFFSDHHIYSNEELKKIFDNKNLAKITTRKDYYRLPEKFKEMVFVVEENIEIEENERFKKIIEAV